jgi:subtilase family serine protease
VIGGSKGGKLTIRITNNGAAAANGQATLKVFASSDATVDAGDVLLITIPAIVKLKSHASKVFNIRFNFPSGVADGSYVLLAQITPGATIADSNAANNVASSTPVTIAKPFVDLAVTVVGATATHAGQRGSITLKVQNLGNTAVSGSPAFDVFASTDNVLDAGDLTVLHLAKSLHILPGKSITLKLTFTVPPAGTYFFIAEVDAANILNEPTLANNVFVTPVPVTIS